MKYFHTPILFQFFDNLETTLEVFKQIKKIKPSKLFLVQDAPRNNVDGESKRCQNLKEIIEKKINWDCQINRLYRTENLGPGAGTADAIKWFFDQVEFGIVLEHDCLPHPDFFNYCETLLIKYMNVSEVKLINGSSYFIDYVSNRMSYHFAASGQLWGWAAWKRSFINYEQDIKKINKVEVLSAINVMFKEIRVREYWYQTVFWLLENKVNTWDYQLLYMIWINNGLIIVPNVNLISNIGFGQKAIHCKDLNSPLANSSVNNILPLVHPTKIKYLHKSDTNYHDNFLNKLYNSSIKKLGIYETVTNQMKHTLRIVIRKLISISIKIFR